MVATKDTLIESIFPYLQANYTNHAWPREPVILAANNIDVNEINFKIQQSLPGNEISFKSIDTVVNTEEVVNYPVEFLNSVDLPGVPPHNLGLNISSPIILLRNLNAPKLFRFAKQAEIGDPIAKPRHCSYMSIMYANIYTF
ncbi:uncharacterized protein LOC142326892 [Lycorma delicatula]|uniref:uncharacterized protein LOC142326892 n=1 Tax=Lycorma delicatula TaxID=130591 RepID=UPI003F51A97A